MSAPDQQPSPRGAERRAAKASFVGARTPWLEARKRVKAVTAELDADGLPDAEKTALETELKGLRESLPGLAKAKRSARSAWMKVRGTPGAGGPSA